MASSSPGVSYRSSSGSPSTDRRAPSTCRVVLGRWDTSPKPTSRVRVRNNEVLPTLVWPTTASFSGLVMAGLQPVQRRAIGEWQLQLLQRRVPVTEPCGVKRFTGRRLQQPDSRGAGTAGQLGNQRQAAAIRRPPWVAGNGQTGRGKAAELFQQFVARLSAVENAGVAHRFRQCWRPWALLVQLDGHQQRAVALQVADAAFDLM